MGEYQKRQLTGVPWNEGKLIGQKARLKLRKSGQSGFACSWSTERATSRFSISGLGLFDRA
jgi:hypothetical protein